MLGSTMKTLANPRAGDIFYIPAIDGSSRGGFVLARYIDAIGKAGYLIEVFSKFYLVPPGKLSDVDTSQRLFRPIMCSMSFRNLPNWKILFHDSSYTNHNHLLMKLKYLLMTKFGQEANLLKQPTGNSPSMNLQFAGEWII